MKISFVEPRRVEKTIENNESSNNENMNANRRTKKKFNKENIDNEGQRKKIKQSNKK